MNQTQGVCINRRAQIHQQSLCCYSPPAPGSCILPNHIQHACVDASNSLMLKAAAPFLYLHQSYRLAMYSMQADCTLNHSALLIGVHATYFLCHILPMPHTSYATYFLCHILPMPHTSYATYFISCSCSCQHHYSVYKPVLIAPITIWLIPLGLVSPDL